MDQVGLRKNKMSWDNVRGNEMKWTDLDRFNLSFHWTLVQMCRTILLQLLCHILSTLVVISVLQELSYLSHDTPNQWNLILLCQCICDSFGFQRNSSRKLNNLTGVKICSKVQIFSKFHFVIKVDFAIFLCGSKPSYFEEINNNAESDN